MTAAVTGEVLLDGRKFVLNTRALVALEARFDGRPATSIFNDASITVVCATLAVGMGISEDEAADLIDKVGMPAAGKALGDAVKAAFPDAAGDDASPQMAASTG